MPVRQSHLPTGEAEAEGAWNRGGGAPGPPDGAPVQDTAISNSERALKVAQEGADVYVRIHANGSEDSSVNGALAMCPSPSNPYIPDLYEDSYRLSECVLDSYCQDAGFANLGVQYYDNMSGINWSQVPVTILEMGFMTNESDDNAMQNEEVQHQMVQGIADGIDQYFGF